MIVQDSSRYVMVVQVKSDYFRLFLVVMLCQVMSC